jgi:hypothetical protein
MASTLAQLAQQAYCRRATDTVQYASEMISNLSVPSDVKAIGHHYSAALAYERGELDLAQATFERVACEGTPVYKARAIQGIGSTYRAKGEVERAFGLYSLAGKLASDCEDPVTLLYSLRMSAVVQAIQGDHKNSLENLENLWDLADIVRKIHPLGYLEYLNSLAVEQGECGRFDQALRLVDRVLATSFGAADPECAKTREELLIKRESCVVSVSLETIPESLSRSKAEAEPGSQPTLKVEAEPAPQPETDSKSCRVTRPRPFLPPVRITSSLPSSRIIRPHLTLFRSVAQRRLLDRFGLSVLPRSPPAHPGD